MDRHIEMKNAPTIISQHQKHVEDFETNCGHREIDGDGVVLILKYVILVNRIKLILIAVTALTA
jgi:hypothetical protein